MEAKSVHREIERRARWDALPRRRVSTPYAYGLLHACYGEFGQGTISYGGTHPFIFPKPDHWDLTVMRATAVVPKPEWIDDEETLFTQIRIDLEDEAAEFLIPSFTPHPVAPTENCTCAPRP